MYVSTFTICAHGSKQLADMKSLIKNVLGIVKLLDYEVLREFQIVC